uniref:ATP synthase F0 subunit 8 n=1 Tax=Pseudoceramium tenerrimum TaxID=196911 RepID=UPI002E76C9A2|nr:ATP synthase F0 subunit 8 [Pseudoceramium tenerrimum]WQF69709.1 ATP synthase F0 subunit 8 [Pseudoceramium tenerrimum]WQF69745.1 ATP synthase F0 subunit 8 [Pseudoceramium tenerrimum]
MPQLDLTIVYTQIFWLCFLFSIFYFTLTFYLLPKFLKSLKLRKLILEENSKKITILSKSLLEEQALLNKKISKNLELLLVNFDKINLPFKSVTQFSHEKTDSRIISFTSQVILFCDLSILKNILFYPKVFF